MEEKKQERTPEPEARQAPATPRVEVDPNEIRKQRDEEVAGMFEVAERLGLMDLARRCVAEGKSIEEFRQAALAEMPQSKAQRFAAPPNPEIGLSDQEARKFSFLRALRAAADGDWRSAQFEREASDAAAKHFGRETGANRFTIPQEVLSRDLTVGTDAAGGYLVSTDLLSASFIELLRNKMVLRAAGMTIIDGLVGDVAIPKQSAGATAYWVAESGSPTESQQTVAQVSLTPKTVGAYTDISRKLLKQSSISAEGFVRNDLASVLALAIDLGGLHGSGSSNQPTGIASTSGIGSVAGGTDGAAPDWDDIVSLETEVAVDNADIGALAYITNAKVRGKLKRTLVTATYGDRHVWERGDTPLNGYPAFVTNQVSSTLTKGSSSGVCSAIFFGNWRDLVLGLWGGLDILVDPYTGGTSGTLRVVALQDVDFAVRHAESFAAMLDALTT